MDAEEVVARDLSFGFCFFGGVLHFLETAFLAAFFGVESAFLLAFFGDNAFFGESLLSYEWSVTTPLSAEVDLFFLRGGPPPLGLPRFCGEGALKCWAVPKNSSSPSSLEVMLPC